MSKFSEFLTARLIATILVWFIPLIFLPVSALEFVDFPQQSSYMFARILGWAYLALCVDCFSGSMRPLLARGRGSMRLPDFPYPSLQQTPYLVVDLCREPGYRQARLSAIRC